MNVYATDKIRNVVLLGPGGAGKTSLLEAMAFLSGITTRLGNVADGTTLSDFDKEEQNRKFSISTSMAPIIWNGVKINVLDTPGYFDFVGEVEEAVARAAWKSACRKHGICARSISFPVSSLFPIWISNMLPIQESLTRSPSFTERKWRLCSFP